MRVSIAYIRSYDETRFEIPDSRDKFSSFPSVSPPFLSRFNSNLRPAFPNKNRRRANSEIAQMRNRAPNSDSANAVLNLNCIGNETERGLR